MQVSSTGDFFETFQDPVFVSEDWALPRELTVQAEYAAMRVEITIEVTRESARARRVSVETDSPKGIGSAMLRRVPVRNAMAVGCTDRLLRVNRQSDGTFALMPGDVHPEDMPVVKPLIESLIGYERLRGEEKSS
jgi:hypothetical protein